MKPILHITNGDGAVGLLQALLGDVDMLPWRDMLHEGPVPAGLSKEELSAVRATYMTGVSGRSFAELMETFRARDHLIDSIEERRAAVIWLEHDLYDQLQLLQILDQLPPSMVDEGRISLAQSDHFLGRMDLEGATRLEEAKKTVTPAQQGMARKIWQAFTAPTPEALATLIGAPVSRFPFMTAAIERLLEELPSTKDGLSRTERQILSLVAQGSVKVRYLFGKVQALEEAEFMGDASFFSRLDVLAGTPMPLVSGTNGRRHLDCRNADSLPDYLNASLALTAKGHEVLDGQADWLEYHRQDCWLGGTHLTPTRCWRWDSEKRKVVGN